MIILQLDEPKGTKGNELQKVRENIQVTNFFELTFLFDQISIHMLMSDKQ